MDYTLFHVGCIADELRESGVSIPGRNFLLPPAVEVPHETEVATSKSSRKSVYLPRWLHKHRFDPAVMVMAFAFYQVNHR
jgi:hypothetical protein